MANRPFLVFSASYAAVRPNPRSFSSAVNCHIKCDWQWFWPNYARLSLPQYLRLGEKIQENRLIGIPYSGSFPAHDPKGKKIASSSSRVLGERCSPFMSFWLHDAFEGFD